MIQSGIRASVVVPLRLDAGSANRPPRLLVMIAILAGDMVPVATEHLEVPSGPLGRNCGPAEAPRDDVDDAWRNGGIQVSGLVRHVASVPKDAFRNVCLSTPIVFQSKRDQSH